MKTTTLHLLTAVLLSTPTAFAAFAWTGGHGDIGAAYEGPGDLHFHLHLGEGEAAIVGGAPVEDQEFEAGDIWITVPAAAEVVLGGPVSFLGASAGSSIWLLPSSSSGSSAVGAPFVGWATEELDPADWVGNITFTLDSVTAPAGGGNFAVWQVDGFGSLSNLAMSTADPGADVLSQAAGVHDHFNIAFTAPGLWAVEMTVAGTHITDGFQSDTQTFFFNVVPEPSSLVLGAVGLLAAFRRRR
jgi:surface-anchored protein